MHRFFFSYKPTNLCPCDKIFFPTSLITDLITPVFTLAGFNEIQQSRMIDHDQFEQ
jgi:hypothetical protein